MISLFQMINLVLIVMLATIIAIILLSMEIEIRSNHSRYESANNSFLTHSNKSYRSDAEIDSTWHEKILIKSELKSNMLNDQIVDNDKTRYKDTTTKTSTALFSASKSQSLSHVTSQKLAKRNKRKITLIHEIIAEPKKSKTISFDRSKAQTKKIKEQKISTPKVLKKTVAKIIDFGKKKMITSKPTKLITIIKSSKRTKPAIMPTKDNLLIPKKPMFITIQPRDVIISHMPRRTTEMSKVPVKSKTGGKGGLIGGIIGVIIIFLIIGTIFGFVYYRKMKKDSTKTQKQKDEGESEVVPVAVPQVFNTPWAPDVINAQQFQYKGPLNVRISLPTELKHDLENLVVESPNADDHIVFDDNLNQVYEIGSEVEILTDQKIAQSSKIQSSGIN